MIVFNELTLSYLEDLFKKNSFVEWVVHIFADGFSGPKIFGAFEKRTAEARFSKVPVTFRARSYILKSKSIVRWRSF